APQQRAQGVLGPGPLGDHLAAAVDQLAPGPHVGGGHVDRRRLAQVQELGQPLRVLAVVLVPGPEDQPQPAGGGHQDAGGQGLQQVVVVAVAAAGLVADLEAVGQALEGGQHLLDAADLAAAHQLPRLAQYTDRDTFGMDIESYVIHDDLHKSGYAGTQAAYLHVTRLTEAPFIVSRRRQFASWRFALRSDRPLPQASGGPRTRGSALCAVSSFGASSFDAWVALVPLFARPRPLAAGPRSERLGTVRPPGQPFPSLTAP